MLTSLAKPGLSATLISWAVRARASAALRSASVPYLAPEAAESIREFPDVEDQGELDDRQKKTRQQATG